MPITGLTDGGNSFRECARLRKGAPKDEGLKDLNHFRIDFRVANPELQERWEKAYGKEPKEINFYFAYPTVDGTLYAYLEAYNTQGLLAKSNGERWIYLRDNKTGKIWVKNGIPTENCPTEIINFDDNGGFVPFDGSKPVYSYKNTKGVDTPVYARPVVRLYMLVPELQVLEHVTLLSHSYYDARFLSSQVQGIIELAQRLGVNPCLIPCVLSRRMEDVSISKPTKHLAKKSLCNISVNPWFAQVQFKALPSMVSRTLELPAEIPEDEAEAPEEDTFETVKQSAEAHQAKIDQTMMELGY